MHNTPLGSYGFMVLPTDTQYDESYEEKRHHVALIRSPRMVVSYLDVGTTTTPVVGTFVASADVDSHLRLSEPASHDRWDPKSARLDAAKDRFAKEYVKAIVDRLKTQLKTFARDASPPIPKAEIRPKSLEKLLGKLFKPTFKGNGLLGSSPADPITIRFISQPHSKVDGDKLRTASLFKIGLKPDFEETNTEVFLDVRCLVAEDEGVDTHDDIPVSLNCDDVDYEIVSKHPAVLRVNLEKEIEAQVEAVSAPYDPNWTTQLVVKVTRKV